MLFNLSETFENLESEISEIKTCYTGRSCVYEVPQLYSAQMLENLDKLLLCYKTKLEYLNCV